ncbi:MAG: T9SS type A sorting domain-containing protein, partial [Bacteroidetes bacterium]|nr:T9SS type A sorting domain-containing protein [Bacteroidota bacterium]
TKPTVSGLSAGNYVYKLTVTDNKGASASAQVTITVSAAAAANKAPVANAGADQTITLPTSSTTLDGSKSSDPDGTIIAYSWTKVSGTGGTITNASTAKPTVSGLSAGNYVYKLTVTDNKGATSSDQVTVKVNAETSPVIPAPVANAGNDTTLAVPVTTTTLNGSGSTGSIASYEWSQVSGPDTATITSPNSPIATVSNLSVGEYSFQLRVMNSQGASSTASIKVTVVNNLRSETSMLLYPNPAQSTINLRLTSDSTGTMQVNIYDIRGTLVLSYQTNKSSSFFDKGFNISNLAHGLYVMQVVIGNNKTAYTAKFLKQ